MEAGIIFLEVIFKKTYKEKNEKDSWEEIRREAGAAEVGGAKSGTHGSIAASRNQDTQDYQGVGLRPDS